MKQSVKKSTENRNGGEIVVERSKPNQRKHGYISVTLYDEFTRLINCWQDEIMSFPDPYIEASNFNFFSWVYIVISIHQTLVIEEYVL